MIDIIFLCGTHSYVVDAADHDNLSVSKWTSWLVEQTFFKWDSYAYFG